MDNETLRSFLERRERELRSQIAAIDSEKVKLTVQLEEVIRAKGTLTPEVAKAAGSLLQEQAISASTVDAPAGIPLSHIWQTMPPARRERYNSMTIKELVIEALGATNGSTATQLRDFMRDAFGRTIEPSSLRPQLKRMKDDGSVVQDESTDHWRLSDKKKSIYTHPSSSKMNE